MKFIERLERTRQSVRNALRNDWDKKKSRLGGPIRVKDNEFSSYIPFASPSILKKSLPVTSNNHLKSFQFSKRANPSYKTYTKSSVSHQFPAIESRLSSRTCEDQYEYPPEIGHETTPAFGPVHRCRTRIKTNPWYRSPEVQTSNIYSKPFENNNNENYSYKENYNNNYNNNNHYSSPKENDYEEIGSRRNLAILLAKRRKTDANESYPHSKFYTSGADDLENVKPSSKEFLMQRHKLCSAIQNIYGESPKRSPRKTFKLQPVPPKRTLSSLSSNSTSGFQSNSPAASPFTSNSQRDSTSSPIYSQTSKKLTRLQAKLNDIHSAVELTRQRLDSS